MASRRSEHWRDGITSRRGWPGRVSDDPKPRKSNTKQLRGSTKVNRLATSSSPISLTHVNPCVKIRHGSFSSLERVSGVKNQPRVTPSDVWKEISVRVI